MNDTCLGNTKLGDHPIALLHHIGTLSCPYKAPNHTFTPTVWRIHSTQNPPGWLESGSFIESTPVSNSFERILSITAIGSHHLVLKQPLNRRRGPVSRLRNDKSVTFGAPTRCSRRVVLWCVRACVTHLTGLSITAVGRYHQVLRQPRH